MSFGYSIGDGLALVQLAYEVYEGAQKACGEHDDLTREVASLHKVLQRLRKELLDPDSLLNRSDEEDGKDRRQELNEHLKGVESLLKIMDDVITKYNLLSDKDGKKTARKLWQKIKFGNGELKDMADVRLKLATYASAISMSLNLCSLGSQGRVEKELRDVSTKLGGGFEGLTAKLDWIAANITAKNGDGTIWTNYDNDDRSFWRQLRRDLINEGYHSRFLLEHKELLKNYVAELGQRGAFDELSGEEDTDIDDDRHSEHSIEQSDRNDVWDADDEPGQSQSSENFDNAQEETITKLPNFPEQQDSTIVKEVAARVSQAPDTTSLQPPYTVKSESVVSGLKGMHQNTKGSIIIAGDGTLSSANSEETAKAAAEVENLKKKLLEYEAIEDHYRMRLQDEMERRKNAIRRFEEERTRQQALLEAQELRIRDLSPESDTYAPIVPAVQQPNSYTASFPNPRITPAMPAQLTYPSPQDRKYGSQQSDPKYTDDYTQLSPPSPQDRKYGSQPFDPEYTGYYTQTSTIATPSSASAPSPLRTSGRPERDPERARSHRHHGRR